MSDALERCAKVVAITDQFAALGASLQCVPTDASADLVRHLVLAELRERGNCLLIFDNAVSPNDVRDWLSGGDGHMLITSREHQWTEIAAYSSGRGRRVIPGN